MHSVILVQNMVYLECLHVRLPVDSFSFEDTVKAVQGSLGYTEPPRTVRTAEATEEYDRKLIEAAKQQSLQEMVCFRLSS